MKAKSKHLKQSNHYVLGILLFILLIFLLGILFFFIYPKKEELKGKTQTYMPEKAIEMCQKILQEEPKLPELEMVEVDMPDTMGNYKVIGKIQIEKIQIEKYLLEETTEESLNLSVTKFWGPNMHEIGNFSVIGHNYKGIFKDLKKLEIGDTFTLISKEGKKANYEIYETYIVNPEDVSCIEPNGRIEREVTLITCTVGGNSRLIIKAKQKI